MDNGPSLMSVTTLDNYANLTMQDAHMRYTFAKNARMSVAPNVSISLQGVKRRKTGKLYPVHRFALEYSIHIDLADGTTTSYEAKPVEAWHERNPLLALAAEHGFTTVRDTFLHRLPNSNNGSREEHISQYFKVLERVCSGEITKASSLNDVHGLESFVDNCTDDNSTDDSAVTARPREKRVGDLLVSEYLDLLDSRPPAESAPETTPSLENTSHAEALPSPPPRMRVPLRRKAKKTKGRKH